MHGFDSWGFKFLFVHYSLAYAYVAKSYFFSGTSDTHRGWAHNYDNPAVSTVRDIGVYPQPSRKVPKGSQVRKNSNKAPCRWVNRPPVHPYIGLQVMCLLFSGKSFFTHLSALMHTENEHFRVSPQRKLQTINKLTVQEIKPNAQAFSMLRARIYSNHNHSTSSLSSLYHLPH